jgi:hypothetical protein
LISHNQSSHTCSNIESVKYHFQREDRGGGVLINSAARVDTGLTLTTNYVSVWKRIYSNGQLLNIISNNK